MSESVYMTRIQAILQSMIEVTVSFEEEALQEVGGKKIHAFIQQGPRTIAAINDMYVLGLIDYVMSEAEEYTLANLDYLADYISNKYPLRAKVRDFMSKIKAALEE